MPHHRSSFCLSFFDKCMFLDKRIRPQKVPRTGNWDGAISFFIQEELVWLWQLSLTGKIRRPSPPRPWPHARGFSETCSSKICMHGCWWRLLAFTLNFSPVELEATAASFETIRSITNHDHSQWSHHQFTQTCCSKISKYVWKVQYVDSFLRVATEKTTIRWSFQC